MLYSIVSFLAFDAFATSGDGCCLDSLSPSLFPYRGIWLSKAKSPSSPGLMHKDRPNTFYETSMRSASKQS